MYQVAEEVPVPREKAASSLLPSPLTGRVFISLASLVSRMDAARDPLMTRGLDANTRLRARRWALCLGVAHLANSGDDDAMKRLGLDTVARAIEER